MRNYQHAFADVIRHNDERLDARNILQRHGRRLLKDRDVEVIFAAENAKPLGVCQRDGVAPLCPRDPLVVEQGIQPSDIGIIDRAQ